MSSEPKLALASPTSRPLAEPQSRKTLFYSAQAWAILLWCGQNIKNKNQRPTKQRCRGKLSTQLGLASGIPVVSVHVRSLRRAGKDALGVQLPLPVGGGSGPPGRACPGGRLPGEQGLLWEVGRLAVCTPSTRSGLDDFAVCCRNVATRVVDVTSHHIVGEVRLQNNVLRVHVHLEDVWLLFVLFARGDEVNSGGTETPRPTRMPGLGVSDPTPSPGHTPSRSEGQVKAPK